MINYDEFYNIRFNKFSPVEDIFVYLKIQIKMVKFEYD